MVSILSVWDGRVREQPRLSEAWFLSEVFGTGEDVSSHGFQKFQIVDIRTSQVDLILIDFDCIVGSRSLPLSRDTIHHVTLHHMTGSRAAHESEI